MSGRKIEKVVITGATGAVGMALIQEFINSGIEVLVLCRENSKRNINLPEHPLVELRYCALDQLEFIQNDSGKQYDAFYHLAWDGTTGPFRDDMLMQNQNVRYSIEAVKAAKRFGCKVFIGAGSQAEYGRVKEKLNADTPAFPENGYGIAKLCAGQMTRITAQQLGMDHVWVRILSIYGPYDGDQSLIMYTIRELLKGATPQLTRGEQIWDYLYSEDAARALHLLAKEGHSDKIYVLGSGKARALSDYILEIKDIIRADAEVNFGAVPYGEKQVMYLCADPESLKKDIGFEASTTFAQGVEKVLEWYNNK